MKFERSSGILLHPTSLPGKYGIGTLGANARWFVDFLSDAEQKLWQICPLGPTGYGNSPYQCFSAFAGNPLLIDLEELVRNGFLSESDIASSSPFPKKEVNYPEVMAFKKPLLKLAYRSFCERESQEEQTKLDDFCQTHSLWLDDYADFVAIKEHFGGGSWADWDHDIRVRTPHVIERLKNELADRIREEKFVQYLFYRQWSALMEYAHEKGIKIIGDIPIFVAYDSADAWAHSEIFHFNEEHLPISIAGVPPDYFSSTGQLWGNPLYDWNKLKETGFQWWIDRIKSSLEIADILRIDHFRGFAGCWAVPADHETAEFGVWEDALGDDLLTAINTALGKLPLIAEDLGVITPDVEALIDKYELPRMKVLQFAFGSGNDNGYLPHKCPTNSVVYTGTHDNAPTQGWYEQADTETRRHARDYLQSSGNHISWDFVKAAWASSSVLAIAPLQDLLELGSLARMNMPGTTSGNWEWRFSKDDITQEIADHLRSLTRTYER